MIKLFETSAIIIEYMFNIFSIIGTFLIDNIIFKILMGAIILFLLINLVFYLTKKIKQQKIDRPYKRALGMTREQFNYEMNRKYLEKFPTHESKLKHLGLK